MRTREFLVSSVERVRREKRSRKVTQLLTGRRKSVKSTEVTFNDAIDIEMSSPS